MSPLQVLSLGGGTQSTVLALRAAEFGGVDHAIFADTGWEPDSVYRNVEWLSTVLPYPVHTVELDRSLLDAAIEGVEQRGYPAWNILPSFTVRRRDGKKGMGKRQCTQQWKVVPIIRKIRDLLGVGPRSWIAPATVEMWLGLSADEAHRCKPSRRQFIRHRFPLVDVGETREDNIRWFAEAYPGRELPRSACVGCPFRSAREWIDVRETDPEMWRKTLELDAAIRDRDPKCLRFLHRRCLPLDEAVDMDAAIIKYKSALFGDGWGNECGGHCGV